MHVNNDEQIYGLRPENLIGQRTNVNNSDPKIGGPSLRQEQTGN